MGSTSYAYAGVPAKRNGWTIRAQPNTQASRADQPGNVQLLCQTWNKPSQQTQEDRISQGFQASLDHDDGQFEAQLQASIADRRERFSYQQ